MTRRDDCPEWCDHDGACAEFRTAVHNAEREAESAWLRAAEAPLLTEPLDDEEEF